LSGGESPVFEARDLRKSFHLGEVYIRALRGVDLTIQTGELVAITGPSGSGKSTLLHLLGCLDEPDSGQILLDGKDVSSLGESARTLLRRHRLGFVFQNFNLVPVLTALENVEYPLWISGLARRESRERAVEMLEKVGLADRIAHRPDQLSGGQRQRVAVARALVHHPRAVLADEPTGNLDSATGEQIMDLLVELAESDGRTFVVATHDARVYERAARRVQLRDGQIVEEDMQS
jgi:putative ABC transport system ATP-binding protein